MTRVLKRLQTFDLEVAAVAGGLIAGIDEAGRGPLAGPVVASAVILCRGSFFKGLNDSKQVLPEERKRLFREISSCALVGIGVVSEQMIDTINIYQATRLAMQIAVNNLCRTPDFLLIDGNMKLDIPLAQRAVVQGDGKSACIAAASIIAKVHRDEYMKRMDLFYPEYKFCNHKGYGTPEHMKAIREFGPCPIHRRSFMPFREPNAVQENWDFHETVPT